MNNFDNKVNADDRINDLFGEMNNKIHYDLDAIRARNINKLEEIISKKDDITGRYRSSLIRDIYTKDYPGLTDYEKNKAINEELEVAEKKVSEELRKIDKEVKNEMIRQAKKLLILVGKRENRVAFDYYNLIFKKPLKEPYDKLESNVYREFMLQHEDVNKIIISYSELDERKQDNNSVEVTAKDSAETFVEVSSEASKALDKLETSLELSDWLAAKKLVISCPDEKNRIELLKRYKKLIDAQTEKFNEILAEIRQNKEENRVPDVDKLTELTKRYELLELDKKASVKSELVDLIRYSNSCLQDDIKEEVAKKIESTKDWKYSLGERLIEFFGMPVNWIRRSSNYLRHITTRRDKAITKGNIKKAEKLNKIYLERDVVSGPIHYMNVNKLNAMKPKLYRTNLPYRSNKLQRTYCNTMASVYNKMYNSVNRMVSKESGDIISNKERAINVVNHYMRIISAFDVNAAGSIKDNTKFNSLIDKTKDLLSELKENGTFDENLYLAYIEEIDNIVAFKEFTPENRGYEYSDEDVIEISNNIGNFPYIKR